MFYFNETECKEMGCVSIPNAHWNKNKMFFHFSGSNQNMEPKSSEVVQPSRTSALSEDEGKETAETFAN